MTNQNTNQSPFELDPEVMDLFKRMKADSLVSLEQSRADMWGALQSSMFHPLSLFFGKQQ